MNYSATNHCKVQHGAILISLVTPVFISITLGGVLSFSRIKNLRNTLNAPITVKVLGGNSFHVMAEYWEHLKDKLTFSSFLVY